MKGNIDGFMLAVAELLNKNFQLFIHGGVILLDELR